MTKDELCKAAGVSPRTIDRDINAGFQMKATYEKIKGNTIAVYADADAQRYIDFRQGKTPAQALAVQQKAQVDFPQILESGLNRLNDDLYYRMVMTVTRAVEKLQNYGVVELKDQMILSASQAAKLSGIPRRRLIAAYKDGILPGFYNEPRVGRGYRFERMDLQAYTHKLSGSEQHEK